MCFVSMHMNCLRKCLSKLHINCLRKCLSRLQVQSVHFIKKIICSLFKCRETPRKNDICSFLPVFSGIYLMLSFTRSEFIILL
jgi:hypothetical protein